MEPWPSKCIPNECFRKNKCIRKSLRDAGTSTALWLIEAPAPKGCTEYGAER